MKKFLEKISEFSMSLIEMLGQLTLYSIAWIAVSTGAALFIAAVFFGIREKNLEEDDHDL